MKILAIDSSAEVCSVAVTNDKKLISEITVNTGNTHSQTLLPAVEQALKLAEIAVDDIDVFACSTGPGSFTGVRIGAATLKGLAYGKNKPCISVSTLEALAYNLRGFDGVICPVMNARRAQVYNALFECKDGVLTRMCADRAISIEELDGELLSFEEPIFLCGDGYDITLKNFNSTACQFVPERYRLQSAYSVAACAIERYNNGEHLTDAELAPVYLRPSQAERERLERIEAQNK
jgi:tRNA threonylcarbamoyladenosine biosynthesis protein TsaB